MRIVSLLPAATEWICAFGAGGELVGRSHACTYPPAVKKVPVVTGTRLEPSSDAQQVDQTIKERLNKGLSIYNVDLKKVKQLAPDLIITQDQCEVCGVSLSLVEKDLQKWMKDEAQLLSVAPRTLKEVLDSALRIGQAVDRLPAAMKVIGGAEKQLQRFLNRLGVQRDGSLKDKKRPTVAAIEWLKPLMVAGHWMPDVIEKAGGTPLLSKDGKPSRSLDWKELVQADPDVLAIMPCGYTLAQTQKNLHYCTEHPLWQKLRAVDEGRVFVFDGDAYYNRPGPRLYRSVQLMGQALHPNRVKSLSPPARTWEYQAYACLSSATSTL